MLFFDTQPARQINEQTVLQRIAQSDKTAIPECINIYGDLIWALARKHTSSEADAERLTLEIFNDLWKYAVRYDPARFDETAYVCRVAQRRLGAHWRENQFG